MSLGLQLNLRQTQQLVMTPQLQQAIKLLAMSNLELSEFVEAEVEKNPLLDLQENEQVDKPEDSARGASDQGLPDAADARAEDHRLMEETFDTGAEHLSDPSPSDGPSPLTRDLPTGGAPTPGGSPAVELSSMEERIAAQIDLRQHLRTQLGQSPADDPAIAALSLLLVEELDEHGYVRSNLDELSERWQTTKPLLKAALSRLQQCGPTGVGARDVGECLALQLEEQDRFDPAMQALTRHLDLLARGDLRKLKTLCGVDDDDFADMVSEIRQLDPRPCASFVAADTVTVIPDILMRRQPHGGWHLELNSETLPKVLINNAYSAEVSGMSCPRTEKFLSDCRANATWLVKSVDQRAKTVLRVAAEIVRRQERFFEEGISGLQPLTLQAVAEAIDMHESTASRVTSNKYIATNRGIFELKFFFTNAVGGTAGDIGDVAATAVRHRIKTMVKGEDAGNVLSDDALVDALRAEGIDVARRTVAKYRKSLNIPSSFERRRMHQVSAQL